MKVVLIYPGVMLSTPDTVEEKKEVPDFNLPLGILYIGQVLKDQGHSVTLFDHYITSIPIISVIDWLKRINPDILGFSVLSANLHTANAIAEKVKEWNPHITTIYGSYLPTFCAENILKNSPYVDICVRGEGEETIVELVENLEKNKSLNDIRGISYRDNGRIIETPDRPLIEDLDSIPFPDRNLMRQAYQYHGKITTIISSRGCPHACRFCSCWRYCRGKWRLRSVENVIEEMQYLQGDGFSELLFTDDCFNARPKRVLKMCYLMKKEKLDFAWHSIGRVTQSKAQFLRTMVDAGCKTLTYGIESANQRILDYYNKRATPEMAIAAVKNAKKAGIENIGAGFIIGAHIETRDEVLNTIHFGLGLQKLGLNNLQFQILYIMPGTALYDEFVSKGILDHEKDWEKVIPAVELVPGTLKRNYLETLAKRAFNDFVTNKRFIISEYLKSAKSTYRLRAISRLLQPRGGLS